MNLIQYDQYTIQRKLYFFFLQNAALSGFVLSSPNLHFHSFSFFQLVGPIKPHNQTWTRPRGWKNQNGERHQCTESLLTSGNGLKEENKTYLTFFSWIHSRAISTVEVLGKSFHIFKGTLGHVTQFFFFQYSFHKITRSSKSEWKMGWGNIKS